MLTQAVTEPEDSDPLNLGYTSDSDETEEAHLHTPEDPSRDRGASVSSVRTRKCRDKKFRSSWLVSYPWAKLRVKDATGCLTVPCEYICVGSDTTGSIVASEHSFWICEICEQWALEAPGDKLGRGNNRWPRGLPHLSIDRPDVFRCHAESFDHARLALRAVGGQPGPTPVLFQPVSVYQLQALKNVYHAASHEQALSHVEWYRQRLALEGVDVGQPLSPYMVLEFVQAIATWLRVRAFLRRKRVNMITGKMWDGSTDVSDADSELFGDSYTGEDGHAVNEFIGRVPVDYKLSRDGRSSDSQAHTRSLDVYLAKLGKEISDVADVAGYDAEQIAVLKSASLAYKDWVQDTPGVCLDAASVNVGTATGSGTILSQREGGSHLMVNKSKAHQLELGNKEAWATVPYFVNDWTDITNQSVAHLSVSPKRQHALTVFADWLGDHIVKISNLHGVRWQESLLSSARNTLRDFRALACEFHEFGKMNAKQRDLDLVMRKVFFHTPCAELVGKQFGRRFAGPEASGIFTATISSIDDLPADAKTDIEVPIINVSYQDGFAEKLCKGQVIECLEAGFSQVLEASPIYKHNMRFTDGKYLLATAFIADWREPMSRMSQLIQRSGISSLKINQRAATLEAELLQLIATPGPLEARVRLDYCAERELYLGIPVHGFEEGSAWLQEIRGPFLTKLAEKVAARVTCTGPIAEAACIMFDFTAIPLGKEQEQVLARAEYGNKEVLAFAMHFAALWGDDRSAEEIGAALVAEWTSIKTRYAGSVGWQSRSNDQMRSFLYGLRAEYPEWAVATNMDGGNPSDNSCCERWVSSLNRIKSKWRARMNAETADNCMMIANNGPAAAQVDFQQVLAIWHQNSNRGRYKAAWRSDNSAFAAALQAIYNDPEVS